MSILELRDKRNKLLHDAQAILLASPDAEKRSQAQAMLADADTIEADITALERIERIQSEERSRTALPRSNPNGGVSDRNETRAQREQEAFRHYLLGDMNEEHRSVIREYRDLTTGQVGQMIPQSFYPVLTEAKKSYGQILNEVKTVETDNGAPMKFATASDLANAFSIVGEGVAVTEADPSIGGSIISTDFVSGGISKISYAALTDSSFDLTAWMKDNMGLRFYRSMANWVVNGNGSNVGGLIPSITTTSTSVAAGAIAWQDIAEGLFAKLDPAYEPNATFAFNAATRGYLLSVTNSLGVPLYIPSPNAQSFDTLLGKRVVISTNHPNIAAGNTAITYGDHSAYLFRTVKPTLTTMVLRERFADQGEVGVVAYARVGGALLQNAAMPPVVGLVMHA